MDFQQLDTFLVLSQYENMSSTAEILHTSQSQISKIIASLEAELGVLLFDRIGRRIRLNEYGHLFARYASDSMESMKIGKAVIQNMNNSLIGNITLGTFAFGPILAKAIRDFSKENPFISFQHVIPTGSDRLDFMNMDMLLCPKVRGKYIFSNHFPVFRTLIQEAYYFVCSPRFQKYPAEKKVLSIKECCQHPFITSAANGAQLTDSPTDASILHRLASTSNVESPKILFSTNEFALKMSYISQGAGFSILPDSCLDFAIQLVPDLQIFDIQPFTPKRTVLLARRKRNAMSSAANHFWDYIIQFYKLPPDHED